MAAPSSVSGCPTLSAGWTLTTSRPIRGGRSLAAGTRSTGGSLATRCALAGSSPRSALTACPARGTLSRSTGRPLTAGTTLTACTTTRCSRCHDAHGILVTQCGLTANHDAFVWLDPRLDLDLAVISKTEFKRTKRRDILVDHKYERLVVTKENCVARHDGHIGP